MILLVGAGHQREQIKDAVISRVGAVAGKWVFTPEQLAQEILRDELPDLSILSPAGRQEYFRLLFANRQVMNRFPILKAIRRQDGFFRRLDQAVLASRLGVAHEEERLVMEERLEAVGAGNAASRREILQLAGALESWMESARLADAPRLFRLATERLSRAGSGWGDSVLPRILSGREGCVRFAVEAPQSLESAFLDQLSSVLPCHDGAAYFDGESTAGDSVAWNWRRSHTLHDSVEVLIDELLGGLPPEHSGDRLAGRPARDWSRQVILIPDTAPDVRMALRRALRDAGIPELDPRDPQELRLSEDFKSVFLPLECVAARWEVSRTLALLSQSSWAIPRASLALAQRKLSELGQSPGLAKVLVALRSALDEMILDRLCILEERFSGRLDFASLESSFRETCLVHLVDRRMVSWCEQFWNDFRTDLSRLDLLENRFPLALWLDRIRGRMDLASPPVSALRPAAGVRIYRMSQANALTSAHDLWLLGIPASWLSPPTDADLYWGSREREQLSGEFAVRSSRTVREARLKSLLSWTGRAARVDVLDHAYGLDGSESERLDALLVELGAPESLESQSLGAHPRFLESYGLVRTSVDPVVELPPQDSGEVRISATALDAMSRCSFLGLPQARWKLTEREEADWDLWPRIRGVLFHQAVERMVREVESGSGTDPELPARIWRAVWQEALAQGKVPGWIRSPQLEQQIERQAVAILTKFLDAELDYRKRSGVRLVAAEDDARLELQWQDSKGRPVRVTGKADRIDEHAEGLFVLDYKTGAQAFKGGDIRDKGYRLQLPFYALAARHRFQKPVLGVQLVELTRDARRSVGLFPKRLNGKEPGMLTQLGKVNSGLYEGDPDVIWSSLEARIHSVVEQFADGRFEAKPVMGSKECGECRARLACGQARREWVQDASLAGETEDGGGE